MEIVIELNNHNKNKIKIFNLILGIAFISISIISLISTIGKNVNTLDVLLLLTYPIAGITWLLSGLGYNLSRFLKCEKLIIKESSIFHDGFFNKTLIGFEQIQSIERKNKSMLFILTTSHNTMIPLLDWDKDQIDELCKELNKKVSTAHNNGEHS